MNYPLTSLVTALLLLLSSPQLLFAQPVSDEPRALAPAEAAASAPEPVSVPEAAASAPVAAASAASEPASAPVAAPAKEAAPLPAGVISGRNAVALMQNFKDELGIRDIPFQGIGRYGKPVPVSVIRWPLPADRSIVRVTPGDLDEFQSAFGINVGSLSSTVSQLGGQLDEKTIARLLDHVDIKRISDREYDIEFVLNPQHCKLSSMENSGCTKDRIYVPSPQKAAQFNALIREHERFRVMNQTQTAQACATDQNAAFDLVPSLSSIDDSANHMPSAEAIRQKREKFLAADQYGNFELQSVELSPSIRMRVTITGDAQGDAVVRVNGFKGIEGHVRIPPVENQLQDNWKWLGKLADKLTQGTMNGTKEITPTEITASKDELKGSASFGLGSVKYSSVSGADVTALGVSIPGVAKFFNDNVHRAGY